MSRFDSHELIVPGQEDGLEDDEQIYGDYHIVDHDDIWSPFKGALGVTHVQRAALAAEPPPLVTPEPEPEVVYVPPEPPSQSGAPNWIGVPEPDPALAWAKPTSEPQSANASIIEKHGHWMLPAGAALVALGIVSWALAKEKKR